MNYMILSTIIFSFVIEESYSLKYLSGDFLTDPRARSPFGNSYPIHAVESLVNRLTLYDRKSRAMYNFDPWLTRKRLLDGYSKANGEDSRYGRHLQRVETNSVLPADIDATVKIAGQYSSQSAKPEPEGCSSVPQRLCKSKFNTTAPMYGVSLTSGKQVTIVQKFPDLLQQVIFEVCSQKDCDILKGDCVQTYIPYLFLVIPLGPVTLTGQDYVLVESGCTCRPKYAIARSSDRDGDAQKFMADYS